jgi:hypothetical protein
MDAVFATFSPDADEFLRLVSRRVDDALLYEIAAADYGHDVDEHLAHLRQIRDQGSFATPMRWHPREVLELIRWSNPENPNWQPGLPGERGHWMRAFACSSLLRAAGEKENLELRGGVGWNQTLIQLIDSLRAIAPELYRPAAAFLAWLILQAKDDDELGFFLIGLLWFALHLQATDDVIVVLSELADAEVKRHLEGNIWPRSGRWLTDTTMYNELRSRWERLGRYLADMDLRGRSPAACDWVKLIGSELAGE